MMVLAADPSRGGTANAPPRRAPVQRRSTSGARSPSKPPHARTARRRGKQLDLSFRTWGGARPGAGRPPRAERAGVSHLARPSLSRLHPVHVTLRVVSGLPSLRETAAFAAVRRALAAGRARFGFRLVHFSVQRDHLHLLAEAEGRGALARGVQGLAIRVARAVNRAFARRGRVFGDRYHARALKTPREVRSAVIYVLMNVRKHARAQGRVPAGFGDSRSSAAWFTGWNRPRELVFGIARERERGAPVVPPRTWLLRVGATRAGPLDPDDAPA